MHSWLSGPTLRSMLVLGLHAGARLTVPVPVPIALMAVMFAPRPDRSDHWHHQPRHYLAVTRRQIGLEAQIPANSASGHSTSVRLQMHFFLNVISPKSIGKPIF